MYDLKLLMGILDCGGAAGKVEDFCCFCECTSTNRGTIIDKQTQEPVSLSFLKEKIQSAQDIESTLKNFEPVKFPVGRKVLLFFFYPFFFFFFFLFPVYGLTINWEFSSDPTQYLGYAFARQVLA